ncbi:hypothetical protein QTP88_011716 [Uroleucon formosanum]
MRLDLEISLHHGYKESTCRSESAAQVSDTPYFVKRDLLYMSKCDGIIGFLGCVTTDGNLINLINRDYYDVVQPKDPSSTNIEYIVRKHGNWRSSFPKSMIGNRNRQSSSKPDISSNKNITTVKVRPTPVSSRPPKVSIGKNLINTFLIALSSPYFSIY